ncbi:MAG: BA14K family protein [Pseudorhodoplanes sp.]
MRFRIILPLAAVCAVFSLTGPAAAQVGLGAAAIKMSDVGPLQSVQYRRYHRGGHYYRGHRRGYDPGAAVAAGIIGLAAGAIIAGATAPQPAPGGQAWIDYCFSKYRSFDPASGTYLGYDGLRHYCR